ncbi:MAG: hypothetical protein WCG25_02175 [bacterium]
MSSKFKFKYFFDTCLCNGTLIQRNLSQYQYSPSQVLKNLDNTSACFVLDSFLRSDIRSIRQEFDLIVISYLFSMT